MGGEQWEGLHTPPRGWPVAAALCTGRKPSSKLRNAIPPGSSGLAEGKAGAGLEGPQPSELGLQGPQIQATPGPLFSLLAATHHAGLWAAPAPRLTETWH